jgi:hypothetical protein
MGAAFVLVRFLLGWVVPFRFAAAKKGVVFN